MSNPDAPRPTRPRGFAAAAVVLALVVVALVAVLINAAVSGPDTTAAVPAPTSGGGVPAPAAPTAASTSAGDPGAGGDRPDGCVTTGTDQQVLTSTPAEVRWSLVQGFAVPASDADGPALQGEGGVGYCFARTPLGALLAAANLGHGTGTPAAVQAGVLSRSTVENQYAPQLAAVTPEPAPGATPSVQLAGFRVISYTPDVATVALALSNSAATGAYATATVALQWDRGDWRAVPQAGPTLFLTVSSMPSLSSYVPFSGVA